MIKSKELDVNKCLNINNYSMAIDGFPDPFIVCTFISDDRVFVNLFYNYEQTHYHFILNTTMMQIENDKVVSMHLESSLRNFPYKCFYNNEEKEIYCFYR